MNAGMIEIFLCPKCRTEPAILRRNLCEVVDAAPSVAVYCPRCNLNFDTVYSPSLEDAVKGWNDWVKKDGWPWLRTADRTKVDVVRNERSGPFVDTQPKTISRRFSFAS